MTALQPSDRPTAVYRLFAADGVLLYVGCSCDPRSRILFDHRYKPWGSSIASVEREWFPGRLSALLAEARAIVAEAPLHNVRRTPPERITTLRSASRKASEDSGLTLAQVAEEVDIPLRWLVNGVANGQLPHSCTEPSSSDVWFASDDIRDLHTIYDLPPVGVDRSSARACIRRTVRFKQCLHNIA